MKLLIGIGNPGEKFTNNRHNVGFMVVDTLAQELGFKDFEFNKYLKSYIINRESYLLAKPTTFMNSSGTAVKKLVTQYNIKYADLWVIHDDLDLRLGDYKIQNGVGPKIHNGLLSIYEKLGTKKFWHIRIGVDNREQDNRIAGEIYVLQNFRKDEIIERDRVINNVVEELKTRVIFLT
jgi:PTH1 family peptidyl-tRNA hydrolase